MAVWKVASSNIYGLSLTSPPQSQNNDLAIELPNRGRIGEQSLQPIPDAANRFPISRIGEP
jgi:hypothetical protein